MMCRSSSSPPWTRRGSSKRGSGLQVQENRQRRIKTSQLNEIMLEVVERQPPPAYRGPLYQDQIISPSCRWPTCIRLPPTILEQIRRDTAISWRTSCAATLISPGPHGPALSPKSDLCRSTLHPSRISFFFRRTCTAMNEAISPELQCALLPGAGIGCLCPGQPGLAPTA